MATSLLRSPRLLLSGPRVRRRARCGSPDCCSMTRATRLTHAVCVGMTGSGKTGLCLSLLEEAAIDGVPAIAIDPKGDLGNLLLELPSLRPEDFAPWIDVGAAARQGVSPEEAATKTAETWRKGLADWDEDGARIARFRDAVDLAIYTPGSEAGRPLSVLQSFTAPPEEQRLDAGASARACQCNSWWAARIGRHPGRSAAESRTHSAVDVVRTGLDPPAATCRWPP